MKTKTSLAAPILILAALVAAAAPRAELEKVRALADRGRTEEALRQLEGLLVGDPSQLEGRLLRGVLLAELGRSSEAERAFRLLILDHPDRPEPTHNLAVLQALGGRPATAILALKQLIDRYPGYEMAVANLDRIRRGAGDGFDPLNPEASRVPLALAQRLDSHLEVRRAASPSPATSGAESPPAAASGTEPAPIEAPSGKPESRAAEPAAEPTPQPEEAATAPATGTTPEPPPDLARVAPAAPASPPTTTPNLRAQLEPVVEAWAAAWSAQRVKEYLGFYASDFQPAGFASREAWEAVRRQRVATPSFIEVEIDLDSMAVSESGPGQATATFVQRYRSDRYTDTVRKTLLLSNEDGAWRIQSETSQ